jgi:riboflavin biosynthesis pyrimidine reductase
MTHTLVSSARTLVAALNGDYPLDAAIASFREALHRHETEDGFAETCWSIDDVRQFRPDISDEAARKFLGQRAGLIQDAMVEAGWEAIETLLDEGDD